MELKLMIRIHKDGGVWTVNVPIMTNIGLRRVFEQHEMWSVVTCVRSQWGLPMRWCAV
jgi:hypothetical protein